MQLHDSEVKSGWAALAPLMAQYHSKMAEAREADLKAAGQNSKVSDVDSLTPTDAEQQMIAELRARDREVRNHEQAHMAVGGVHAGGASYTYQIGPDGKRYAIGGEVPIDISPVSGDPEATIAKMEQVKAAALAPAEPSGADRKIAALADATRAQAQADLVALRSDGGDGSVDRTV